MSAWKTRTYYICKEPGMDLWMGLQNIGIKYGTEKVREVFPFPLITDCKCRNCRYTRWRNKRG